MRIVVEVTWWRGCRCYTTGTDRREHWRTYYRRWGFDIVGNGRLRILRCLFWGVIVIWAGDDNLFRRRFKDDLKLRSGPEMFGDLLRTLARALLIRTIVVIAAAFIIRFARV